LTKVNNGIIFKIKYFPSDQNYLADVLSWYYKEINLIDTQKYSKLVCTHDSREKRAKKPPKSYLRDRKT
jgi:hypothetical protein